jgi:beta-lactamase regulating signal transducer with metallopeptidase domain
MILWMLRAISVACLVSIAALVADAAAREAGRERRWIWLAALALSVVLPIVAPSWINTVRGVGVPATLRPSDAVVVSYIERSFINTILVTLWGTASFSLFLLYAWADRRARRSLSGASATIAGANVLVSDELGPAVIGLTAPRIVMPRWTLGAAPREQTLIVRHESEHVRGRDTILLAGGAAAVVCMPWNPVVWWQSRRLRRAVEMDCDARVLASGCDVAEYGATLLTMAARASCLTPLAPLLGGTRRMLEQRIREMTADPAPRRPHRLASLAAASATLLVAATASAIPAGPTLAGRERVVVRTGETAARPHRRASLVLLDGRPSSYEEIRTVARAGKLGPLKIIMPEHAIRVYGPRAVTGALIANTR